MYIDAHTHINQYDDSQQTQVVEQINNLPALTIGVSMDLPSWQLTRHWADQSSRILPSFGIHPWRAPDYVDRLDELDSFIRENPLIGEIGLDYRFVEDESQYPAQRKVFEYFLQMASGQPKLLNLHTSGAECDILEYLGQYELNNVIIHWYNGPLDLIPNFLDLGCYFTIGVEILFNKRIQSIARQIPSDRLLTETDNPESYPWLKNTDEPGVPKLIVDVYKKLAEVRSMQNQELQKIVFNNFINLTKNLNFQHID